MSESTALKLHCFTICVHPYLFYLKNFILRGLVIVIWYSLPRDSNRKYTIRCSLGLTHTIKYPSHTLIKISSRRYDNKNQRKHLSVWKYKGVSDFSMQGENVISIYKRVHMGTMCSSLENYLYSLLFGRRHLRTLLKRKNTINPCALRLLNHPITNIV
jgi:hypothetical protein